MLLSKTCIYAIRAVLFTAASAEKNFVPIRHIAKELDISFHFLTKILQNLTQRGIMNSYRGPKGGIALAKPANDISIAEIITAIDGNAIFEDCILGLPGCGEKKPCPLHLEWGKQREKLEKTFNQTSISDLVHKIEKDGLRIAGLG